MERRTCLAAIATGIVGATAGCPGRTGSPDVDGSDVALEYPLFPPAWYDVEPNRVAEPAEPQTPFAELTRDARVELATAVHRGSIWTGESPALLDGDHNQEQVGYRDEVWDVRVGVADAFTEPEHGPEGDPNWEDPVALSTSVADGELTLSLTNALDATLPVHYRYRPAFGVVVAVGETADVLDHEGYADSASVRTDGFVRAEPGRPAETDGTRRLSPGESLEETYTVPDGLTGAATIRPPIWIGDDAMDRLDNRRQLVVATISPEF